MNSQAKRKEALHRASMALADFVIEKLNLAGNWSVVKSLEDRPGMEQVN